ncbi:KilA-N domain [Actinobacillus seminis]|uniref:KilA-N domain n=1 Tax=Actinobacillus seminis TaxID=722 RepID=A0A380VCC4_9PAST|nr:KilA-N domain-containing protein [Actinobacillus seminis]SUU35942.1 KilA-N domain [Actinobacillus seminis]
MSNLTILNTTIRQIDNLFSLNELHKLSGSESKHQPTFFIRLDTTKDLVAEIQKQDPNNQAILSKNGIGTYACKEIVIAYAAWISPQFHLVVLRAFLNQLENSQKTEQTALPAPTTLTPEEQYMVQNAVKATHEKTGLSYGEIWARTKNKFKVAKYEQIERSQLNEVLTYITSLTITRTVSQNEVILSVDLFEAIMKHTRLAKKLAEQTEIFHRQLFLMLGLERHIRNDIGALSYDVAHEFNPWLQQGEAILKQHQQLALPRF